MQLSPILSFTGTRFTRIEPMEPMDPCAFSLWFLKFPASNDSPRSPSLADNKLINQPFLVYLIFNLSIFPFFQPFFYQIINRQPPEGSLNILL